MALGAEASKGEGGIVAAGSGDVHSGRQVLQQVVEGAQDGRVLEHVQVVQHEEEVGRVAGQ